MDRRIAWIAAALIFSGCTMEPKYDAASVSFADQWKNKQTDGTPAALKYENWWDVFQDARLTGFIQEAVKNNQDLIAAHERIEQARALAKITRSKLFPHFNISPMYNNQEVLSQLYGPGLPHYPFVTREHQREYALPLMMSWEIDLWGKIRSEYKSAKLRTKAVEEAYRAAMLVVTTELANAYFQLRILDAQIELYQSIIQTRKKTLELNASRYEGELINMSEVAFSDQELNITEAQYYEKKQRRALFENMIAVLLGKTPSDFSLAPMPFAEAPPKIPDGVPSEILSRRPDLAEQERNMESIHALLGVVYAEYFPSINATAGLGWVAPLSRYFLKGLSRFWEVGTSLTEIVFDAGARRNKVKLTWAQYRESVARYRQSVLSAFQEVEDSLSNLQWNDRQMQSIATAVKASKVDAKISSDRYKFGVGSYLPVTEKQRQELDNEETYLTLLGHRYMNTIQLIRALGGGW